MSKLRVSCDLLSKKPLIMSNDTSEKRQVGFSVVFLFYFVLCIYPFLSSIWRRAYPLLTSEVIVILFVLVCLSLALAAIFSRIRMSFMGLVTAILVTVVFLIQFDLSIVWAFTVFLATILLVRIFKSNFYMFGLIVISVMLAASLVENIQESGNFDYSSIESPSEIAKPPVIHIVLDSFIGVGGLPAYSASSLFKDTVEEFFKKYEFELFTNAYSRYATTVRSLNSAMNFSDKDGRWVTLDGLNRRKHELKINAYFDILAKSSYRLNVYQTEYLNFCRSNPKATDKCWNPTQPNILTVREIPELRRRVSMLGKVLLSQSSVLKGAFGEVLINFGIAVYDPLVIKVLKQDLFENPDGNVFFAHLLIPHSPFVFLNDCSVKYEANPVLSYARLDNEVNPEPELIEYRTLRYFEQSDCALTTLATLFNEMKSRSLFDQAYIVVHGDHGSQISRKFPMANNINMLTIKDYKANYSTLFAVKLPYAKFAKNYEVLPISTLLEEFGAAVASGKQSGLVAPKNQELVTRRTTPPYIYVRSAFDTMKVDINIFEASEEN